MKPELMIVAALALAACQPQVPDSGTGAGFGNPGPSTQEAPPPAAAVEAPPEVAETPLPSSAEAPTGEEFVEVAPQTRQVVEASPGNAQPQIVQNVGISDENDFDAVAGRESIQSDAERLASNRARYTVISPTDLPNRSAAGANIVEYAVTTTNPVGAQLYSRFGFNKQNRMLRNCAKFPSADLAQQAFLDAGGPVRDRSSLDPDGDGFACSWDPSPFRAAVRN